MLYYLATYLTPSYSFFNVVHYVSFRAGAALFTAFGLCLWCAPYFLRFSQRFLRAKAREHTPDNHKAKDNVPTMGGILILISTSGSLLLWASYTSYEMLLLVLTLVLFGAIGGYDDWAKIRYRRGISERLKLFLQITAALVLVSTWYFVCSPATTLEIPFCKNGSISLGIVFIVWALFVMVGSSNAVNLTDGLDGLAISSLIINFATFSAIAYVAGHSAFAHYLHIPHTPTAELAVFGAALVGGSLGFLWFNAYPAHLIMGDAGALALGATLGFFALMTKQELLLAVSGGLFVIETISVMLQVLYYKKTGTRLFRMAPLHHHFEMIGWKEPQIMIRFTIITFLLCLVSLLTLKIR